MTAKRYIVFSQITIGAIDWNPMEDFKRKILEAKSTSLFVLEGKNDYLLIGLLFLFLAFFLLGGFYFR